MNNYEKDITFIIVLSKIYTYCILKNFLLNILLIFFSNIQTNIEMKFNKFHYKIF